MVVLAASLTSAPLFAAPMVDCEPGHAGEPMAADAASNAHAAMGHTTTGDVQQDAPGQPFGQGSCCPDCPSSCASGGAFSMLSISIEHVETFRSATLASGVPDDAVAATAPSPPYRPPIATR